jgi:alpha-tubulin suppressor-like RCC1 family protein
VVSTPSPVPIPNGEGIVSVAAGRAFTCAVSDAGKVYCWGSNDRGQLGDGSVQQEISIPNEVPGVAGAVGVTAGDQHACAWLADKTVVCWGANESGQLGDGTLDDKPQATVVTGLSNVVQVSAGTEHTCARHADGSVSCWGSSYDGQSGTGVLGYYATPLAVQGL